MTAKNPQKQGRILDGGGATFFWLARIYIPTENRNQIQGGNIVDIKVMKPALAWCS